MGCQGGCEQKIEVFVKIQKKNWGAGGWGGVVLGDQGGCERRIEVFGKIKNNNIFLGGRGGAVGLGGVKVDVIEELMFLGKFTKKNGGGVGRGGGGRVGGGGGGGSGWM